MTNPPYVLNRQMKLRILYSYDSNVVVQQVFMGHRENAFQLYLNLKSHRQIFEVTSISTPVRSLEMDKSNIYYAAEKSKVDDIVNDRSAKEVRVTARRIYHQLKFFHQPPKEKKELWRRLGKCLSLNDFQFEIMDDKTSVIRSVSSLNVSGSEAQGLSVDCLRSFCANLGIGKSGRLKKNDLIKKMHMVWGWVSDKRTAQSREIHCKVQERIRLETFSKNEEVYTGTRNSEDSPEYEDDVYTRDSFDEENERLFHGESDYCDSDYTNCRYLQQFAKDKAAANKGEYDAGMNICDNSNEREDLDDNIEDAEKDDDCEDDGSSVQDSSDSDFSEGRKNSYVIEGIVVGGDMSNDREKKGRKAVCKHNRSIDLHKKQEHYVLDSSISRTKETDRPPLDGEIKGKRIKVMKADDVGGVGGKRIGGITSYVPVDLEAESKIDGTMKYLMKSLLHHQRLSGEYQGYINTFVQLRDYHELRSDQLKHKLDEVLKRSK